MLMQSITSHCASHFASVLLVTLTFGFAVTFANETPSYVQAQNVVFGEVHGTGLLMDVFTPKGAPNGLGIVDVASGAWYSDRSKIRDHTLAQIYEIFCSRGYVVFAVRPGSKTRYTALEMDQHVKMAVRFIKENADEYKIDRNKIGLTGASAGGHLATLASLTPLTSDPNSKNKVERHDTTVAAVAVFFPPTDFLEWRDGNTIDPKVLAPLLAVGGTATLDSKLDGASGDEFHKMAKAISPLYQVGKPTIPFLLIHGDADEVVPLSHSQKLVNAIRSGGGDAELIIKAGGGHPWLTLPVEVAVMADWFDRKLKQ
jgi:acetyl esterase/lipase